MQGGGVCVYGLNDAPSRWVGRSGWWWWRWETPAVREERMIFVSNDRDGERDGGHVCACVCGVERRMVQKCGCTARWNGEECT